MWFELFEYSFDETIIWAFEALILGCVILVALELIVNKVCNYIEKKCKSKHIRIVLFNRFIKEIEL